MSDNLYSCGVIYRIKNTKCTSFFQLNGINKPEMNSFKYININKADYY